MATAPTSHSLECAVCLGVYNDPRLLPNCHHTFCAECIKGVADQHTNGTFPCPSCRKEARLPPGGVASLQKNFYINPEDLSRARQGVFHCSLHTDQRLDMYCRDCKKVLCLKCVLTKHKAHETIDLAEAAASAKSQLEKDKQRLGRAIRETEEIIQKTTKEHEALRDKKLAIERNLRNRHAVIVTEAERCLQERLASLETMSETVASSLLADLESEERSKRTLHQLQTRVQNALDSDLPTHQLDVAKEMEEGDGCEQSVQKLIPKARNQLTRLVLRCASAKTEDVVERVQNYFGDVDKITFECTATDDTTVERFYIAEEADTEVFSMCVEDDGSVHLSYTWRERSGKAPAQYFDNRGRLAATFGKPKGRASFKSRGHSSMFFTQVEGRFKTHSKSKEHFSLSNNLATGEATVQKTIVTSETPFKSEDKAEFTIPSGPHRAFDVDSTGQYFVIVEESGSDSQRKVRLFTRPQRDTDTQGPKTPGPVASRSEQAVRKDVTYSPPVQPFQPADVCFYKNDMTEVLLIADEMNDAIHMVRVQDGQLMFKGYLCPGHPLLVQPTALTVDSTNRVWIACRGRVILIVQPDLSVFDDIYLYYIAGTSI